ncbi:MAG: ribonuclease D [Paracoccaceae bacterium]|nr:ribonuclease D [Paracoccaceae bacterium]
MKTITKTSELKDFCDRAADEKYITIDTEFLRERTYFSKLCLVQLAIPGDENENAVIVDTLVNNLDLSPLYEVFKNPNVVKVFHAARQDLEIFYLDSGIFPYPLFDTQIAAMVCGFGDQIAYETLVRQLAKQTLDKSSRFTDWSRRPLTDAQKKYALADVTHLRIIYETLSEKLLKTKRLKWVDEELEILISPKTYDFDPKNAWRRLKTKSNSRRFLGLAASLAEFREVFAQTKNIPRNRVIKDDALLELASNKPKTIDDLSKSRLLLREARKGEIASGLLGAIEKGLNIPDEELPEKKERLDKGILNSALSDLLRVLLKSCSESSGVASKLIASAGDLDALAAGDRSISALNGWRFEVFGKSALELCDGKIGLIAKGTKVKTFQLE